MLTLDDLTVLERTAAPVRRFFVDAPGVGGEVDEFNRRARAYRALVRGARARVLAGQLLGHQLELVLRQEGQAIWRRRGAIANAAAWSWSQAPS